jgi:hypothetical protein
VFAGNSDALAAATQLAVQASLQQWLGDLVEVEGVRVERDEGTLQVTLQYLVRRNQDRQIAQFRQRS